MNWWQFGKWFGKWISQWTDRSVNKAVNESVNESVKYLVNESVNKFVNKSANESVNVTHFTLIDSQNLGTPDRPPHTHTNTQKAIENRSFLSQSLTIWERLTPVEARWSFYRWKQKDLKQWIIFQESHLACSSYLLPFVINTAPFPNRYVLHLP